MRADAERAPSLADAPELGGNIGLDRPVTSRRATRLDARLVIKPKALAAMFVSRHPGERRSRAEH